MKIAVASAFSFALVALPLAALAQGWTDEGHLRLLADVNGDGRTDIVGFDEAGVLVALGGTDGAFTTPKRASTNFGSSDEAGGWRVDRHPRVVEDVNGDGFADIVGFGESAVRVALGQPDGTFAKPGPKYEDFYASSDGGGWSVERHPRLLGDVNGDGLLDIVGFGGRGVRVALGEAGGRFAKAEWVLENFGEAVVARDCEPDEVEWITAEIPLGAPDKEHRVYVDCSLALKQDDVVYKRLILDPAAAGVTIDCNGAIIDGGPDTPNEDEEMVQIVSKLEGGIWKRPTAITIRDCEIIGRIRIWGMGRNGEAGAVRFSSRRDSNHVERVRAAAPSNIHLDKLKVNSTGTALYLGPGVTFVSLTNSELSGNGTRTAIYLDAESGYNTISNNYIHVKIFDEWWGGFNRLGPQISVDASNNNEITDNWFSALEGGGIYLYRNCGEGGTVRHGSSSNNQIRRNAFFYNRYDGDNPSVFIGSRGQWYRTISDDLGYCDDDENKAMELNCVEQPYDPIDRENVVNDNNDFPPSCQEVEDFGYFHDDNFPVGPFPWGSSASNEDHAKHNIIEGNQICKLSVGRMIRQGNSSNRPNVIRGNRTIPAGGTWRAGDYSGVC